jgi:hypothetical protein
MGKVPNVVPNTHNWQARGCTNAIGALMGKLLVTVGLFETNVNADVFYVGVIKDLLPKRPPHPPVSPRLFSRPEPYRA